MLANFEADGFAKIANIGSPYEILEFRASVLTFCRCRSL